MRSRWCETSTFLLYIIFTTPHIRVLRSPKKPKSKKKVGPALSLNLPTASTSALKPASTVLKKAKSATGGASKSAPPSKAKGKALGTKESPIPLEDEDEESKADVFGGVGRRASVKGKEKAEDGSAAGDGDEAAAIAEGVNRMKGKWKERVAVNGVNGDHKQEDVEGTMGGDGEEDEDEEVGKKRKRAVNGGGEGAKKKPKIVDVASFHPDLQVSIENMKQAIAAGACFPPFFGWHGAELVYRILGNKIQVPAEPQAAARRTRSTSDHARRVRRQLLQPHAQHLPIQ